MKTLPLDLGERSYPIYIGSGLLGQADLLKRHIAGSRVAIVTNDTVAPLYLAKVREHLGALRPVEVILPDGEAAQDARGLEPDFRRPAGGALRPAHHPHCAGWRRHRRHGRFCRGQLPARRALHPGADHAAVAGGFLGRRQDRGQSSARQEHDRRVLPAARGDHRYRHAQHPAGPRTRVRAGRGDQVRPDPRSRVFRLARGQSGQTAGARPGGAGLRHPPLLP